MIRQLCFALCSLMAITMLAGCKQPADKLVNKTPARQAEMFAGDRQKQQEMGDKMKAAYLKNNPPSRH